MSRIYYIFLLVSLFITGFGNFEEIDIIKRNNDLSEAMWIGDGQILPETDSLFYIDDPFHLFRKEFSIIGNIKGTIKSAMLYFTAARYYQATINRGKIGDNFLESAWTNYSNRNYYTEYDITKYILNGKTVLV